jgi:hypothetical protein
LVVVGGGVVVVVVSGGLVVVGGGVVVVVVSGGLVVVGGGVVVVGGGLVVVGGSLVVVGGSLVVVGGGLTTTTSAVAATCGIAVPKARSSVRATWAEKLGAFCAVVSAATGAAATGVVVVVVVVDAVARGRVVGAGSAFTCTEGGAVGRAAYTMIPTPMARKARKAPTMMRRSLTGPSWLFPKSASAGANPTLSTRARTGTRGRRPSYRSGCQHDGVYSRDLKPL